MPVSLIKRVSLSKPPFTRPEATCFLRHDTEVVRLSKAGPVQAMGKVVKVLVGALKQA